MLSFRFKLEGICVICGLRVGRHLCSFWDFKLEAPVGAPVGKHVCACVRVLLVHVCATCLGFKLERICLMFWAASWKAFVSSVGLQVGRPLCFLLGFKLKGICVTFWVSTWKVFVLFVGSEFEGMCVIFGLGSMCNFLGFKLECASSDP